MLIKREKEVLNVIIDYMEENGYGPSVRDICGITGLKSTGTVRSYLKGLQTKGFIERKENFPRVLRILRPELNLLVFFYLIKII